MCSIIHSPPVLGSGDGYSGTVLHVVGGVIAKVIVVQSDGIAIGDLDSDIIVVESRTSYGNRTANVVAGISSNFNTHTSTIAHNGRSRDIAVAEFDSGCSSVLN